MDPIPSPSPSPRDSELGLLHSPRGDYRILRQIGSGSFSVVFLAMRKSGSGITMQKMGYTAIPSTPLNSTGDVSASAPLLALKRMDSRVIESGKKPLASMYRKEGELCSRLVHPNIIKVHDVFDDGPYHCILTDYAAGGDLLMYMQRRMKLPEDEARDYTRQLAKALEYAHGAGIVHRDVKLENILLSKDEKTVLLADWGFALEWNKSIRHNEAFGSLHYSAPEIVLHHYYIGPELDSWSLGVVIYAMISGRLPFRGNSDMDIAPQIIEANYLVLTEVSKECVDLLDTMLTVDPQLRITIPSILKHKWVKKNKLAIIGTVLSRLSIS